VKKTASREDAMDDNKAGKDEAAKAEALPPMVADAPAIAPVAPFEGGLSAPELGAAASGAPEIVIAEADKIDADKAAVVADDGPTIVQATASRELFLGLRPRTVRYVLFAGAIAIAGALGSIVGALTGAALARPEKAAPAGEVREMLVQLHKEIAALKGTLETSNKTANAQLTKLSERLDRTEKAQAEPAAKLARIAEAVDRLEKKTVASLETTGSIVGKQQERAPIAEGWVLRDVYGGRALIENRDGLYEVVAGSTIPGLGRIENIRRQDGRWVVVTARGLIVSAR
jgi:hypothetical protein